MHFIWNQSNARTTIVDVKDFALDYLVKFRLIIDPADIVLVIQLLDWESNMFVIIGGEGLGRAWSKEKRAITPWEFQNRPPLAKWMVVPTLRVNNVKTRDPGYERGVIATYPDWQHPTRFEGDANISDPQSKVKQSEEKTDSK